MNIEYISSQYDPASCPSDQCRTHANMHLPDVRQLAFVTVDGDANGYRRVTAADLSSQVACYPVNSSVPQDVRVQWDTARNLWLYSWHVWYFHAVAERHALSTLEMALRIGLEAMLPPKFRPSLRSLMEFAIKNKVFLDEHIQYCQRTSNGKEPSPNESSDPDRLDDEPQKYCKKLAEAFSEFRNDYSHGSSTLLGSTAITFSICRDLISRVFEIESSVDEGIE